MSRKTVSWFCVGAAAIAFGVVLRVTGVAGVLLAPLQTAVTAAADWVSERVDIGGYRAQYEEAQAELTALRRELAEQEDAVHTAAFYRAFLALKETRPSLSLCDARVIAARTDSFTVNVGTVDGVTGGEPVMTAHGLVGVVAEAGLNWARVFPLTHESVTVSVTCSRTAETAEMNGGVLRLHRDSEATTGDRVMTSGYGGKYPRGLLVGELQTVTADSSGLSRSATVRLYAEAEERVMVILGF